MLRKLFDTAQRESLSPDDLARHAALMVKLGEKLLADREALEKPLGNYRIIKRESPPHAPGTLGTYVPPPNGWYVQKWQIASYGYGRANDSPRFRIFLGDDDEQVRYDLERLNEDSGSSYIEWSDVWSGAFPSKREAEHFLKRWLKPDEGTVYGSDGEPVS